MLEHNTQALAYPPHRAAEMLGVGRSFVYDLIGGGLLDARKMGRRTVVTHDSLVNFLSAAPRAEIRTGDRLS